MHCKWPLCIVRIILTILQLFELLTGESLFDPTFQTDELDISKDESHLIQMIELLGDVPVSLIHAGNSSRKWFTEDGEHPRCVIFAWAYECWAGLLRIETTYYPVSLASILERHIEKSEVEGTTQFLETLLRLNPEDRANPEDIFNHEWFSTFGWCNYWCIQPEQKLHNSKFICWIADLSKILASWQEK